MNVFQLVLKQMRQRALSSWLTMLSVLLGVALAIAIVILRRESAGLFGQKDFGYDVIVGAKGSPLQLTLNTVYHIDRSPGNISYSIYEQMMRERDFRSDIKSAVPMAVGDSYQGRRIVGTLPKMFGIDDDGKPIPADRVFEYRLGKKYEMADGRVFAPNKFEAVIGSDIQKLTGLKLGDEFKATHGLPHPNEKPDVHDTNWKVVGVLKKTNTASDCVIFIPLISFYAIAEHDEALIAQNAIREGKKPPPPRAPANASTQPADDHDDHGDHDEHDHGHNYHVNADGTIDLHLPKDVWGLSAILIRSRGGFNAMNLMYRINNGPYAVAVNPATTMREFFDRFFSGTATLLLAIAALVTVVAAVGILVSIYNSVSARMREIAILRALGATRGKVLLLICLEAATIGLVGAIGGLIAAHLLAAVASAFFTRMLGEGINWLAWQPIELLYLLAVVILCLVAGLVPAIKAYRVPVADNLVAG
ncbi:MAG: ABC transporter permease [Anaerolineae bacterium]|nr:ABC transporter permease [Phycisphaerae bacterium]